MLASHFCDLASRSYQTGTYQYTGFLSLADQSLLISMRREFQVPAELTGGSDVAERKIAVFGDPESFGYDPYPDITAVRVTPLSRKFAEKLEHRDVLGAVLNLGIERETVGDIYFQDQDIYLCVKDSISSFITDNLTRIRHTQVMARTEDIEVLKNLRVSEGVTTTCFCSSLRLDSLVAAALKMSRGESQKLINEGRVYINSAEASSVNAKVPEGSFVSVRGSGRFRFNGVDQETRKGRLKISVEVFGKI